MTINGNEACMNGISLKRSNLMTRFDIVSPSKTSRAEKFKGTCLKRLANSVPSVAEIKQYIGVILCGVTIWGSSWFIFQDDVLPGSSVFNMTGVVIVGYIFGHTLERYTKINPVVGMTLTGSLYRYFGPNNFLEDPMANAIDYHLRRIYPVIILTKGPLGWNWEYIQNNSIKVFSLATLPWVVECLSTAFFAHVLLDYPWYWGIHLGAILASVSPAIVVPTVTRLSARGLGLKHQIAELVANAGGLDTAFTEGMCGVINSAIFYPATPVYRISKALLAIFLGIGLGILWGVLNDLVPDHKDFYAPTVRSLLILFGGVLLTYAAGYLGWGGTCIKTEPSVMCRCGGMYSADSSASSLMIPMLRPSITVSLQRGQVSKSNMNPSLIALAGVGIMVCAGAAATRWARRGWPINDNPVAEVYKLLWRIFEPMLFTLSGYFLDLSRVSTKELSLILACMFGALFLRLLAAFLVCLANELSLKESLFIAITWIPKAIVEAVLVRVATDSLWTEGSTTLDERIATQHSTIIVIAILITSTLGSILTTILGPILLSQDSRVAPEGYYHTQRVSSVPSIHIRRRSDCSSTLQLPQ